MILIQVVLIAGILAVLLRFLAYRNSFQTQAWKKILLMGFILLAIVLILWPDILNNTAHFLGVGRGADLLLYALTVAFIFEQINNYVKDKEEKRRIAALVRRLAIAETLRNEEKRR